MPNFMQNLMSNPGGSGVYGNPQPQSDNDVLSIVNRMKDREMQDYKNRSQFDADLQLRQQQRMKQLFDPSATPNALKDTVMGGETPSPMGTQSLSFNPADQLNPEQRVNLALEQQKLAQSGKFGQEALDIKSQQEQLNREKSDQINATKQADLQRKVDESNQKLDLANRALQDRTANQKQILEARKAYEDAMKERYDADRELRSHQYDIADQSKQRQLDDAEQRAKDAQDQTTTTTVNPEGTQKTVEKKSGAAARTVQVKGRDGKIYNVPENKVDDVDSDGQPHWTRIDQSVGGGDQGGGDQNQ